MSGIPMQFNKLHARALPVDARLQPENSIRLPGESIRRPLFFILVLGTTVAGVSIRVPLAGSPFLSGVASADLCCR